MNDNRNNLQEARKSYLKVIVREDYTGAYEKSGLFIYETETKIKHLNMHKNSGIR